MGKIDNRAEILEHISQNKALIHKVVKSYCSNTSEHEDLVQEIILQLLINYDKFDHKVKVTTWMYRVALNIAISHFRKVQTHKKKVLSVHSEIVQIQDVQAEETDENIVKLRAYIQDLKPLSRAILIMYLDGNSHQEISEAIGISLSNVGTKIGRIKKQLKQKFNKK